ncbi:Bud-site selection protein [Pholiota conissans]|uniref:Bud-site selection protein n=1 Tax=Pholiota conissans TaxID=109636 RepID=A0A9P5Z8J9_9AGAR|nr:Bud-site selection protein [Pholiota conissans]
MSVRVGGKLHHEMKEVHKASKKAKIFETQKVVKRLKDIRKKSKTDKSIAEFESELTTLKEISHDAIGNSALRTKVLKDHTLRNNEDVKAALKNELENNLITTGEPGSIFAKIQSRLLSSKILATQVTASIVSLKVLLNPALKQRDNTANVKADPTQSSDRPSKTRKTSASHDESATKSKSRSEAPLIKLDEDEDEAESDEDTSREEAGWESGSINEEGVNDDGWESGDIEGGHSGVEDSEDEDEKSDEESDGGDEELKITPATSKPQKRAPAAAKPVKGTSTKLESTFLPSLSVGFVRGGSDDSDFSDTEGAAADIPKKNRRGQRARQAIWEKKFGRNANHKKKEAEALAASLKNKGHARSINTGSNAVSSRTLPTGQGSSSLNGAPVRGKAVSQQHQPVDSGWAGRSKEASGASNAFKPTKHTTSKPDKNEQKIHPSWEAKRKLKEKESVGIVPSQGKKIVFT